MNEKTIFIVDDDSEVCESLRWLFESDNLNVKTYNCGAAFLSNYHSTQQGCLVLDIGMPNMSGIELLERLNKDKKSLPTVIMSGYSDIPIVVRSIQAGAVDFILKPINDQYLLDTVHYYLEKHSINSQYIFSPQKNILTSREQEVLKLILNGKFNKEIAYELNIAISTVEAHRSRIMSKFKAKNLAQLIKNYFQIPEQYYE